MSFSVKADMNKVCSVSTDYTGNIQTYIMINCERNNVLYWSDTENSLWNISRWCRFDRNIERNDHGFTCILYSNKGRETIYPGLFG